MLEQFKSPFTKAFWTAVESFLAVVVGTGVMDVNISTLEAGFISAVSAAITVILVWVRENKTNKS